MLDETSTGIPQGTSDNNSNIYPKIVTPDLEVIDTSAELKAMHALFEMLSPLGNQARNRAVRWLLDVLEMDSRDLQSDLPESVHVNFPPGGSSFPQKGVEDTPTPRSFMSQKKPNSLVERIACLAYYLSTYRDTPHFKTSDLVSLNTEAAAPKFGNPSRDSDNADRQNGYLVTAGRGLKQITPRGEAVVQALPDREAVSAALRENPYRARRPRDASPKRSSDRNKGDQ
ncbi:hypothetical protein P3L51_07150 [Streptomyces sp. PSRA5]|uniref:hypothetical protein n=1 Tax=Streptomyces panacea TaxID=3035064 RepID=UPI00339BEEB3